MLREIGDATGDTSGTVDAVRPIHGGYTAVNGLALYYEMRGVGKPLVMLHGGLGGIAEFGALPTLLAQTRQVIAVELQAHGHTADIDRPLRYESMADDIAALIGSLGLEQADIFGFSMGGGVALRTAMQHPNIVRKLVLVSTPAARSAIHQEFRDGMAGLNAQAAPFMFETPMYQLYRSTAPDVSAWSTLVGKVGDLLRQEYDWSVQSAAMPMPALVIVGDADMLPVSHLTDVFGAKADTQIEVLPQTSHFNILSSTDSLVSMMTAFLDKNS